MAKDNRAKININDSPEYLKLKDKFDKLVAEAIDKEILKFNDKIKMNADPTEGDSIYPRYGCLISNNEEKIITHQELINDLFFTAAKLISFTRLESIDRQNNLVYSNPSAPDKADLTQSNTMEANKSSKNSNSLTSLFTQFKQIVSNLFTAISNFINNNQDVDNKPKISPIVKEELKKSSPVINDQQTLTEYIKDAKLIMDNCLFESVCKSLKDLTSETKISAIRENQELTADVKKNLLSTGGLRSIFDNSPLDAFENLNYIFNSIKNFNPDAHTQLVGEFKQPPHLKHNNIENQEQQADLKNISSKSEGKWAKNEKEKSKDVGSLPPK